MDAIGLVLIVVGLIEVGAGVMRIRGPLARIRQLDETAANLQRYEMWRGKQTGVQADGPTGADEMRAQMRQRVIIWGVVMVSGAVLILVGLLLS